jgi:CheY-like chemotaxis protein
MQNILLVDDDSTSNFLSMKTLERMGFVGDINSALNGEQALDLFNNYYQGSRGLPHIILLDLNMPIMDGFGFLEAFNRLNLPNMAQVKIIIVSSSADPDDIKRAKDLGVSRYISKPLGTESLRAVLECE